MLMLGWGNAPKLLESSKMSNQLVVRVSTEKEAYGLGESVRLTIIATDESDQAFNGSFSSGQSYDFIITDIHNKIIWQWSNDKLFTMAIRPFTLKQHGSISYSVDWDQTDNNGDKVSAGEYYIEGILTLSPKLVASKKQINIFNYH